MNTKKLAFIIMMGALGNVLFAISFYLGPIAPGIALDFSLIVVFIAGFFGGPKLGFATGIIAGVLPGIMFGPMGGGGWLGLIGLPLGKSLAGIAAGVIAKGVNMEKLKSSLLGVPLTLLAYVPEGIFTYAYFTVLLPLFLPPNSFILGSAAVMAIMIKAVVEVTIMGFVIAALLGNKGFKDFVGTFFYKPANVLPEASQVPVKSEA